MGIRPASEAQQSVKDLLASLVRQIDSKAMDRLALAATLVLTILLAYGLATLTWSLLPEPAQPAPPPPQVSAAPVNRPNFERIAGLHLFGQARVQADAAPLDAPETRLNLTLRGILFNPMPRYARAIIAAPGRQDEQYRVGDQVPGGATISQILRDRVMLLHNGRYETLRLPEERLGLSAPAEAAGARLPPPSDAGGGGNLLADFRRQIVQNPESASQYIQAEPVTGSGGGITGFRVNPGADASMFQVAGLQPGDIVTQINGVRLDSVDKGFDAMEQLAASDQVTLRVLRNGQEMTLHLQLRE